MSVDKGTGRLVLAPEDARQAIPAEHLSAYLAEIGFLGDALPQPHRYRLGDDFLRLITFMGCSPHIELDPPADGGSFCHLHLPMPLEAPRLLHGRNTQPPRCHSCRNRLTHWGDLLPAWVPDPVGVEISCPHCGHHQSPLELGWRHHGGFGRSFVLVEDIFPGEAVPVPGLMQALKGATGTAWDYFYILD